MRRRVISPRQIDWLAATVVLAWALPNVPWRWDLPSHTGTARQIVGYSALALATAAPVLWRRRFPLSVVGAEIALLVVQFAYGRNLTASVAAVAITSFGIGAYSSVRRWALPISCLCFATGFGLVIAGYALRNAGVVWVLVGAAILAGDTARARQAAQESAVDSARLAERAELARELHDVLAHQLSAIAVQAGATRLAGAPSEASTPAARALATIEVLSRDALTEVSQILGVLRHDHGQVPALAPMPTLSDIDKLFELARGDGTSLSVTTRGDITAVDAAVGLCAYRVIQESLTNIARHAPGAPTTIAIDVDHDSVSVSIVNRPSSRASTARARGAGGGRGVRGMRERVESLGGRFAAAPTDEGGFAVTARDLNRNDHSTRRSSLSHG